MIHITRLEDGFEVVGHANHAEHGRDIVCASISVLSYTALRALQHYSIASYIDNGDRLVVFAGVEPNSASEVILETFMIGVRGVAEEYPEYVLIQEEIDNEYYE